MHLCCSWIKTPGVSWTCTISPICRKTWSAAWLQGSMTVGLYTIWVNYNISLTWIKAIWGWFPLLTMIPVRSQWGRYNLPWYHGWCIMSFYTMVYIPWLVFKLYNGWYTWLVYTLWLFDGSQFNDSLVYIPRHVFSRMRSKGSRFTLGVWGLRVCSLDVASASATVRNRSCEDRMAVPMGSFAEVVLFGGFRRLVASFRVAGVALRDIQTCSGTRRKSFCVAGAILLLRFQKMCCSFSWQAQHFGRAHRHFSWQAQHFRRVVLRVFCTSHWQGCVKWRQVANSVAGVAFCDMCWKLTEASHETSILRLQMFRF